MVSHITWAYNGETMGGGRKETVDDREILGLFREDDDPVLFTQEVAQEIGFSSQGTLPRLHNLAEEGLLESKKGGRSIVWWLTQDGQEYLGE